MEVSEGTEEAQDIVRPRTAPDKFCVSVKGLKDGEQATLLGQTVGACVNELSLHIDLSGLDGVTIAVDYRQAVLDLDRGYESSLPLTPTEDVVVGVAMTPTVMRDGNVKSHIVLNAAIVLNLLDPSHEGFRLALHLLAHECAHVEVTRKFDSAFPGILLQHHHTDIHETLRWKAILACWDEYAATWISAGIGRDPTADYEDTFLEMLENVRARANDLIRAYRIHSDVNQVLGTVYGTYSDFLKLTAYHLGNMVGQGLTLDDLPRTRAALERNWFSPYFDRLGELCGSLAANYGQWPDQRQFEAIGDLADELLAEGGLILSRPADGSLYVDIPFTPETMPDEDT